MCVLRCSSQLAVLARPSFRHQLPKDDTLYLAKHRFLPTTYPGLSSRDFGTSTPRFASHFDTHLFVQRLKENGLTEKQAEGLMKCLAEVIDESVKAMEGGLVSKADQEKVSADPSSGIAALKAMSLLDIVSIVLMLQPSNDTPRKSTLLRSNLSSSSSRRMT